jgi:hypothetical protein
MKIKRRRGEVTKKRARNSNRKEKKQARQLPQIFEIKFQQNSLRFPLK